MAWVNSLPSLAIPLPLASPPVAVAPVPHAPLLVLLSPTSVLVHHAHSLLPLTVHTRLAQCLETHGNSTAVHLRHVSVNTASSERAGFIEFYVVTEKNYVLVYHMLVNHSKSQYEICHASNGDNMLQNALPLALANLRNSLSSMLKSATQSLIHGSTVTSSMANIEHFEHGPSDDEARNEPIPFVKLSLVKILKLASALRWFWCKPNSHSLIFVNGDDQIQLLNTKTYNSDIIALADYLWFSDFVLLLYNPNYNYFLALNENRMLSLLGFDKDSEPGKTLLIHTQLATLDVDVREIQFSPQAELALFRLDSALRIYALSHAGSGTPLLELCRELVPFESSFTCFWSPCGGYFVCICDVTNAWKLFSSTGALRFDSNFVESELKSSAVDSAPLHPLTDFCKIRRGGFASNARCLYLMNSVLDTLYKLELNYFADTFSGMPAIIDENYISFLPPRYGGSSMIRVPIFSPFQKCMSNHQSLNGVAGKLVKKKHNAKFAIRVNEFRQISLSYGSTVAISTPISFGTEVNQVFWYQFYNHLISSMNIVDHFWIGDCLVLINRYQREDEALTPDVMIDEIVILDTAKSKNGAGGTNFKFDSDLIAWRHTFRNMIVKFELLHEHDTSSLVLVTSDMKIIVMEINLMSMTSAKDSTQIDLGSSRITIQVKRTIHFSSIKHKLELSLVKNVVSYDQRHYFFLLDTGQLYLLKNQLLETESSENGPQRNNMYDLSKMCTNVESMRVDHISFGGVETAFLTLFSGDEISLYDLAELVERTHDFEITDTEQPALEPIKLSMSNFSGFKVQQSADSVGVIGLEYQVFLKNDSLHIVQRPSRQLVLNKLIRRDLLENGLAVKDISQKYSSFRNYNFCLELLLFEHLENSNASLRKVCELVNATSDADSIYVNFLRKIEIHYWEDFFELLRKSPLEFMTTLMESNNVNLCYNYLSIYLNYKKESERSGESIADDEILGSSEQSIVLEIVMMLQRSRKWEECFELCRFIKFLQPLGELLRKVRSMILAARS